MALGARGWARSRCPGRHCDQRAEHEAGVHQQAGVALEVLLEPSTPKAWALGHDLGAGAPTQARRGEHVLPGCGRLFEDLDFDLLIETVVGAGIAVVGDSALAVAEIKLTLRYAQRGAVPVAEPVDPSTRDADAPLLFAY